MSVAILSSDKQILYTLANDLAADPFGFSQEGPAALLWIAMHLSDPRPWTAARNPMYREPGLGAIDQATKRVLGKRFHWGEPPRVPRKELDPYGLALSKIRATGHDFTSVNIVWPSSEKVAGKLQARRLWAHASIQTPNRALDLYSRNFAEISQCLHAELSLLLYLIQQPLTLVSFALRTTLKPCRMCAAFLHQLRHHTQAFKVEYEQDDPGPLASRTLLDQYGYQN
jgi:hypothetical protein